MKLITVIIPVYNVEEYLHRCVESVCNQTYKNLEIILVDDASPDNCPKMCDEFVKKDKRIKVIHKQNEGLGLTRNAGLLVATGEYVTFIDSDDWISPNHIENLYNALFKNGADVVVGSHSAVTADKVIPHKLLLKEGVYEGEKIINDIVLPLIGTLPDFPNDIQVNASSCMNLYSLNVIRENDIQFVSERYAVGEDLYFNIDFFAASNKLVAINETGYFYFENCNSISRKYNPKRFERSVNFYYELWKRVESLGLSDAAQRINRSFLMKVRVAMRLIVTSNLTLKEKINEIKKILNHDLVVRVLREYPIEKFIFSMRVLVKFMRCRNATCVYLLLYFREFAKRGRFLSGVLKLFGIGR